MVVVWRSEVGDGDWKLVSGALAGLSRRLVLLFRCSNRDRDARRHPSEADSRATLAECARKLRSCDGPWMTRALLALAVLAALPVCHRAETPGPTVLSAPADRLYTHIDRSGTTVAPNGRLLRPVGRSVTVAPHPFGLTLNRTGDLAITANSGTEPLSISIIDNPADMMKYSKERGEDRRQEWEN